MSANGIPAKPPLAQAQIARPSVPPNQTLHISNLPDKIHKHDSKRLLYDLFSPHGHILDVIDRKTRQMRGQAHVVFRDAHISSQAMRALQGYELSGRPMRVSYGKGKSNVIATLDGSAAAADAARARHATQPGLTVANTTTGATDLQKAVFAARPGASTAGGLLAAPAKGTPGAPLDTPSPQGTKRPRDDDSDSGDAPMDEDDEGEAMDVSDDD